MRKFEHSLIGIGAGLAVAHVTGSTLALTVAASIVGASIPDLDLKVADRSYVPRPGSCCKLFEHRGPSHSLSLALVSAIVLDHVALSFGIGDWLAIAFCLGWFSHLAGDAISPFGQPYLWPLSWRRFRLLPYGLRIRSGTRYIELPLALLVLVLGVIPWIS